MSSGEVRSRGVGFVIGGLGGVVGVEGSNTHNVGGGSEWLSKE